jgi:hypothetical protein
MTGMPHHAQFLLAELRSRELFALHLTPNLKEQKKGNKLFHFPIPEKNTIQDRTVKNNEY